MSYASYLQFIADSLRTRFTSGASDVIDLRSWAFGVADSAFYIDGSLSLKEYDDLNAFIMSATQQIKSLEVD